jgi:hypothetical protein
MKVRDLVGQTFGRLTVVGLASRRRSNRTTWECKCTCGEMREVRGNSLLTGNSASCGCLARERWQAAKTLHGMSTTRTFKIWLGIKTRCLNPHTKNWPYYGGRGISICKEWQDSFSSFFAAMGVCPPGLTIERIDNDGNYEPGNCKWATRAEQNRNKRDGRKAGVPSWMS